MPKRNRPVPGSVTVREIRVAVCTSCGCTIGPTGLCDMNCPLDADVSTPGRTLYAVYKRTDEFLRDEPAAQPTSTEPQLESEPNKKGDS